MFTNARLICTSNMVRNLLQLAIYIPTVSRRVK